MCADSERSAIKNRTAAHNSSTSRREKSSCNSSNTLNIESPLTSSVRTKHGSATGGSVGGGSNSNTPNHLGASSSSSSNSNGSPSNGNTTKELKSSKSLAIIGTPNTHHGSTTPVPDSQFTDLFGPPIHTRPLLPHDTPSNVEVAATSAKRTNKNVSLPNLLYFMCV